MNLVLRLGCTLLPMVLMQEFLHATGPLGFFYWFLGAGCFIPLLPLGYRRQASLVFFILGAFIGLTLIVIQPLAGFLVWFDLVPQGAMRGPVSVVFMYIGGYLSLIAVYGLEPGRRFSSLQRLLFVHTLLAFIIFRLGWLLALAGIMLPGFVIAALFSRPAPLHRWRGLASFAGIGLVAALVTFASAPGQAPVGIFVIDEYLSGFLRDGVFRFLPDFPVLYGFSGYGHGFSEERLGARPLLSERALFAVEGQAGSTNYLRTKAFDTFTGKGWTSSTMLSGSLSKGMLPEAGDQGPVLPESLVSSWQILLRLSLLMDYYPLVPQILGATTVLPGRTGGGLEYEGSPAAGLALRRSLVYGERLVLGRPQSPVPMADPADDPELYRAIPEALPPIAVELASVLHGLSETELIAALTELLADGFTYSLDPEARSGDGIKTRDGNQAGIGNEPGDDSFLQLFLAETRTGYCVHFASAAVLLARLAGVPARYVTGFLLSIPQPDDDSLETGAGGLVQVEITGLNSHAWAELWLPSTGWVVFEATPPMRQTVGGTAGQGATRLALDDFTLRQLAAITGGRVDLRKSGKPRMVGSLSTAGLAVVLLVLVLSIFAGFGLYRLARKSGWHSGELAGCWLAACASVWSRNPGLRTFGYKARRIVRLAAVLGVPGPERDGWLAWEDGVSALLSRHGVDLDEGVLHYRDLGVFREVFFGCRPPENHDFARIDKLAGQLHSLSKRYKTGVTVR